MIRSSARPRLAAALCTIFLVGAASAQVAGMPPQNSPSAPSTTAPAAAAKPKRQAPHPLAEEAPGGGPDKVWVNLPSGSYHCPGDRYYGRTAHGRYMTEAAAKSAGAHGPRGKDCPAAK